MLKHIHKSGVLGKKLLHDGVNHLAGLSMLPCGAVLGSKLLMRNLLGEMMRDVL